MGRRQRRRSADQFQIPPATRAPASRIARVRADEDTWAEFKQAIGDRSVAEVLGRYVETEVARARARRLRGGEMTDDELLEALDRAAATTDALRSVAARLEQLRRHRP